MRFARLKFKKRVSKSAVDCCWWTWLAVREPLIANRMIKIGRRKELRSTRAYLV